MGSESVLLHHITDAELRHAPVSPEQELIGDPTSGAISPADARQRMPSVLWSAIAAPSACVRSIARSAAETRSGSKLLPASGTSLLNALLVHLVSPRFWAVSHSRNSPRDLGDSSKNSRPTWPWPSDQATRAVVPVKSLSSVGSHLTFTLVRPLSGESHCRPKPLSLASRIKPGAPSISADAGPRILCRTFWRRSLSMEVKYKKTYPGLVAHRTTYALAGCGVKR